ncbi:MAG: hypothetical protein BWK73_31110 [Thiothrix lacustris]|uniref:Uncharacterized protein n=1 Tax=Thiothrix lacustris TaxID=525917 RepID=A0A1Y1QIA2_9GAMM|nr:MAG: hypothetical protein BWK73_31110 [Thiothrix lacustris]
MADKHVTNPFLVNAPNEKRLSIRDEIRQRLIHGDEGDVATRSAIRSNDNPRDLTDQFTHDTLQTIEQAGLREATLPVQPWAGHYSTTAMRTGLLGFRYQDLTMAGKVDWQEYREYVRTHPAQVIIGSGSPEWVAELSPAEKYDALIGDRNSTLTRQLWATGQQAFDRFGEVPGWFGICHGWSPASFMLPRPQQAITLLSPDNKPIKFYPADIKALASLLWARAAPPVRFIGGRCNLEPPYTYDPETQRVAMLFNPYIAEDIARANERWGGNIEPDPELPEESRPGVVPISLAWDEWDENGEPQPTGGRLIANECVDTNPGTWHLAIVNQLGVSQRSMIMDSSFSDQVWNQPLYAYRYTYFNPHTLEQTDVLDAAKVNITNFSSDIFHKYRSPAAVSVVGVIMRVTYAIESAEAHEPETQPIPYAESPEAEAEMRRGWQLMDGDYYYDLELDAEDRVIGGEWYTRDHPDFLWTPEIGARAVSRYEGVATGAWDTAQAMPVSWRDAAVRAARDGVPLAGIVERMIDLANS